MRITLAHITKRFDEVAALADLSCEIGDGELFFLLGPSGCGKTTLLRVLAGFVQPDSGRVLFDGVDITDTPPHRRPTAMVFQGYALWPHMTVAQNVAFGLEMQKVPRAARSEQVRNALEQVRIAELADRRPNELSGGQQQRVALARTLAAGPRCLLLDEPLANLDAKLRIEMRVEIRRLCKENQLTAVYVTHDQKEALSMSDRLAVMDRGRILQVGTPHEVYTHPVSAFIAEFIGETNFVPGRVHGAADRDTVELATPLGTLRAALPARDLTSGDPVTLSVRPEVIRIVTESDDAGSNTIRALLIDSMYLGDSVQYRFRVEGDLELRTTELNPRELRESGRFYSLSINPSDVRVLPPHATDAPD
ncbi:MAG: ABC transporter ATP-binding protein [Kiritimatiellaeota bacterium]|nr:ABC transporter ATP-binding protein [Kiritimatiellota bacterium]